MDERVLPPVVEFKFSWIIGCVVEERNYCNARMFDCGEERAADVVGILSFDCVGRVVIMKGFCPMLEVALPEGPARGLVLVVLGTNSS